MGFECRSGRSQDFYGTGLPCGAGRQVSGMETRNRIQGQTGSHDEIEFSNFYPMAIHNLILYNGRIISAAEAFGRAGQVGLLSGWGVFSTLRMMQGIPFAF